MTTASATVPKQAIFGETLALENQFKEAPLGVMGPQG